MKSFFGVALIVAVLLLLVSGPALAGEIRISEFSANVDSGGKVVSDPAGENTGWSPTGGPGVFIVYPWVMGRDIGWNQWFYNDPPSEDRSKWIEYDITIAAVEIVEAPDIIEVAINWSAMAYPENPNEPPLEDPNGTLIERYPIYHGPVSATAPITLISGGPIIIPDYNPEWVSIDIRPYDQGGGGMMWGPDMIDVYGEIRHQCVPEPSTLVLLAVAALALVFIRRR